MKESILILYTPWIICLRLWRLYLRLCLGTSFVSGPSRRTTSFLKVGTALPLKKRMGYINGRIVTTKSSNDELFNTAKTFQCNSTCNLPFPGSINTCKATIGWLCACEAKTNVICMRIILYSPSTTWAWAQYSPYIPYGLCHDMI